MEPSNDHIELTGLARVRARLEERYPRWRQGVGAGLAAILVVAIGAVLLRDSEPTEPKDRARWMLRRLDSATREAIPASVAAAEAALQTAAQAEAQGDPGTADAQYREAARILEQARDTTENAQSRRALQLPSGVRVRSVSVRADVARGWRNVKQFDKKIDIPAGTELRLHLERDATIEDLKQLAALPPGTIQSLVLEGCTLDSAAMTYVAGIAGIADLALQGNPVTDEGVAALTGLFTLRYLNLNGTKITDASAPVLASMQSLRSLAVKDTEMTRASLPHLVKLTSLEVFLPPDGLQDADLELLRPLDKLHFLTLVGAEITDNGIAPLLELKNLNTLCLLKTSITDQGFRRIETTLPACDLTY